MLFWWSCPLCCVSFPLGAVVGNGPLMLVTAIGVCLLMPRGCWAVFLSFGGCLLALGGFCPPGVFVFFPRVVALAFVFLCSRASAFSYPIALCSFCSWFVAFCASGLLLLLLLLLLFFSSFYLFFLFLAFFFFGCLCSLWSPSCFPCLALPGVWPSLVLGLVGPS